MEMMKNFFYRINFIVQPVIILLIIFFLVGYTTIGFSHPLTTKEREWLKQHEDKITFALETNYAPFAFVDKNGKSSGLATEYLKLIQKKLGFSLQEKQFESFNDIIESAKKNEVDIVNAVTETEIRSRYLLFTKPFIEIPNVIIVKKDNFEYLTVEKLKTFKVSTVKNYAITEYLSKNYSYLNMDLVSDDLTALLSVSFNRTDCAILDLATASYLIDENGITNLRVAGDAGYNIKLSIASRKDWPILNQILNKGLAAIRVHERESIRNKWISIEQANFFKSGTFWGIIISITSGFLFCLLTVLIWNRTLKKQVFKRTNQLTSELKERKKAEKNAVQAEKRFRDLFESISDLIFTQDIEGRFLSANPAMQKLFGYTEEEFLNKSAAEFMESELRPYYETTYLNKIKKLGYYEGISSYFKKDGSKIYIDYRVSIVTPSEGEPYLSGIGKDVTDKIKSGRKMKQLETQIVQSQKMESVGRLAGGVAHDFNNMLSIILGNSEIMMEDIGPEHPCSSNLKEIQNAAQRSADLTRQLLAFARKQTISPKVLNPNHVIEGMLNMLKRLIGEDIDLLWRPQTDLWPIKIDPSQIDQILANLCINARDALKDVGKVTIETGNISFDETYCEEYSDFIPGDYIVIGVSDNGCGMDRETTTHLFEPFFTTKEKGEGTGLGLATVYGIIKQNNGFINVYSEPSLGTTFKIYLPKYSGNSEHETKKAVQKVSPKGHETILLVEDEDAILQMTKQMLERLEYTVLAANTPDEAIRTSNVSGTKIDLLITDVVMPSMNGRELAEKILLSFPDMKCLYMSGYTANVIAHRGILDEGLSFINKPFSKQELSIKLREILD